MIRYGKMTGCAVSALSALAENHAAGIPLSSGQIAESRNYSKMLVAKVMTILSRARLVKGVPGPGGGYQLTREPADIRLLDVVEVFEETESNLQCPFGPGYCGNHPPCPLHDKFAALRDQMLHELAECDLGVFTES